MSTSKIDETLPTNYSLEQSSDNKIQKEHISLDVQTDNQIDNNESNNADPINDVVAQNVPLNVQNAHNLAIEAPISRNDQTVPSTNLSAHQMTAEELRIFYTALPEAKMHMNKIMALFVTAIVISFIVRAPLVGITHLQLLIIASLVYAFAWGIIEIYWSIDVLGEVWIKSGDFFKALDAASFIFLILTMLLRATGLISNSLYAIIPFLVVAQLFFSFSKNVKKDLPAILTRFYNCAQVITFLLKLDDHVDWTWNSTFILTWIFLAAKIYSDFIFFRTLVNKMATQAFLNRSLKVLGFIWHFGLKVLEIAPFVVLYGFVQYYNSNEESKFISNIALANIAINTMLLFITLLIRDQLITFILRLGFFKSLLVEYVRERQALPVKKEVALQVENKQEFFVKISPTYFAPLHKSLYAKSKEQINKIKAKLLKSPRSLPEINDLEENSINYQDKLSNSLDNIIKTKDIQVIPTDQKSEETLCYICYSNPSNVILMNCGHGGICYECAVPLMKKKNKCMHCRKDVAGIFMIDPNPKLNDIVRGFEFQKLVL